MKDLLLFSQTCLDCADYDMEMAWQKYEQAKDEGTLDLYRDADCEDQDV